MCLAAQGTQNHDLFLGDEIAVAYFDNLRSRAKNTGKDLDGRTTTHLSSRTQENTKYALCSLITKLGLIDSDHVISDLRAEIERDIETKRKLERKLSALANEQPITAARMHVTYFKGVMRRGGGVHLNVACDNHFQSEHKAIDPLTLRDIRNRLTKDQGLDADLIAFTGERPKELYGHRISQFRKLNDDYYALDSIKFQNKGGFEHFSILPATIAEAAIERSRRNGWTTIRPNWIDAWRGITQSTTIAFGVHLTAKYLRERFKTIAHEANMPANHYNFLEGSKPKEGANAAFYDLRDEAKFLREYDLLLSEALSLTAAFETFLTLPLPYPFTNDSSVNKATVAFFTAGEIDPNVPTLLRVEVNVSNIALKVLSVNGITVIPDGALLSPIRVGQVLSETVTTGSICAPHLVCIVGSGNPVFSKIALNPVEPPFNDSWQGEQNVVYTSSGEFGAEIVFQQTETIGSFTFPSNTISMRVPPTVNVESEDTVVLRNVEAFSMTLTLLVVALTILEVGKKEHESTQSKGQGSDGTKSDNQGQKDSRPSGVSQSDKL